MTDSDTVTRKPVGNKGIDGILYGGIPQGHTVLIAGESGTGKTVLSMEWLFRGYEQDDDAGLYLTLTESVTEAVRNVETLSFYDSAHRGASKVRFADLRTTFDILQAEGELDMEDADQLVDAIGQMVDDTGADRVVIDSITAIAQMLDNPHLIRTFIFRLDAMLEAKDVTTILTSEAPEGRYSRYGVEEFISDGIIHLTQETIADQERRGLRVVKMRGTGYRSGVHHFAITEEGIGMFPYEVALNYPGAEEKYPTGVQGLDRLLDGGFLKGTSTVVAGPSGSGKSLMGLRCIYEHLQEGRRCMLVSFEESTGQILRNAERLGWDLEPYVDDGTLIMHTVRPESVYPEEHLSTILETVAEEDIDCLLLDSMSVIGEMYPEDVFKTFARNAIFSVKARGVTGIFTFATADTGHALAGHGPYVNTIADNVISLANIEIEGGTTHTLSILKTRGSGHSKEIHEYVLTGDGPRVGHTMSAYRGITTGSAEKVGPTTEERLQEAYAYFLGPLGREEFHALEAKTKEAIQDDISDLQETGVLTEEVADAFRDAVSTILAGEPWHPTTRHTEEPGFISRLLGGRNL